MTSTTSSPSTLVHVPSSQSWQLTLDSRQAAAIDGCLSLMPLPHPAETERGLSVMSLRPALTPQAQGWNFVRGKGYRAFPVTSTTSSPSTLVHVPSSQSWQLTLDSRQAAAIDGCLSLMPLPHPAETERGLSVMSLRPALTRPLAAISALGNALADSAGTSTTSSPLT